MPNRADTSWHDDLPLIIADGLGLEDAAELLHVSLGMITQQLPRYPALREAVAEARRASGRRSGMQITNPRRDALMLEWGKKLAAKGRTGLPARDPRDEVFFAALGRGLTILAAADEAGIPISTVHYRRRAEARFGDLVCEILRQSGTPEAAPIGRGDRKSGPPRALTPAAGTAICRTLRNGGTLQDAADAVGVTPQTIKRARYADPDFDQRVVAAGLAGGRRFTRLTKPPCPGPKCGTVYGYDMLGCREPACRETKIGKKR